MVAKKKRGHPDLEDVLARPWCYYCERDFDDLKILISHQKAKHFKCERCGRRLNTAGGLSVHMNQVHKETLTSVDNALGNRASLDVEIFGMEGIPDDVVQAHNQRIITQFYQAEADRRAASGNHGPGGAGGGASKKPKFESPAELKKRLAEHKAKKAQEAAGGGSSGGNTPAGGMNNSQSPAPGQSPAFHGSPYAPPPVPYSAPPGANYGSFSQEPFAQPAPAYQPPFSQQPAYTPPLAQFPPQPQFSAPPSFPPQPAFSQPGYQQPPNFPAAPPHYVAGTPPGYNPYQPPPHIPQNGSLPPRPASLPQAPGLPQRPAFNPASAPPFNAQHQGLPPQQHGGWGSGGWSPPDHQNPAMSSAYPHSQGFNGNATNASSVDNGAPGNAREPDDIDELIRMAEAGIKPPKKEAPTPTPASAPAAAQPSATPEVSEKVNEKPNEKKSKKEKDKPSKMIYSDNEISPEEKMAKLSRYAFIPDRKDDTAVVEVIEGAVAGTVDQ